MSKNVCLQGHFCEAVNVAGARKARVLPGAIATGLKACEARLTRSFHHEQKCLLARTFLRSRQCRRSARSALKAESLKACEARLTATIITHFITKINLFVFAPKTGRQKNKKAPGKALLCRVPKPL